MSPYILLFRFKECVDQLIPVMLMSDENQKIESVIIGKQIVVRDIIDNERKDTFRQLLYKARPNEVQTEIKLLLSSQTKIKKEKDLLNIPLETEEKLKKKI